MDDLNDKVEGNTLSPAEWNQVPSELQNIITDIGISLSSGDLNQLGKAIASYISNGNFYMDSGVADAYVLGVIGSKQNPFAYVDGMECLFRPGSSNTGASTVNVAGLGVKDIRDSAGAALTGGELVSGRVETIIYNSASGHFRITGFALLGHNHSTGAESKVDTSGLADASVTASKIGTLQVTSAKIASAAVDTSKLAASAVTSAKIGTGEVKNVNLAQDSVKATEIDTSGTYSVGSQVISATSSWVVPAGVYSAMGTDGSAGIELQMDDGASGWRGNGPVGGAIISNGSNVRINNTNGVGITIYYTKLST